MTDASRISNITVNQYLSIVVSEHILLVQLRGVIRTLETPKSSSGVNWDNICQSAWIQSLTQMPNVVAHSTVYKENI